MRSIVYAMRNSGSRNGMAAKLNIILQYLVDVYSRLMASARLPGTHCFDNDTVSPQELYLTTNEVMEGTNIANEYSNRMNAETGPG